MIHPFREAIYFQRFPSRIGKNFIERVRVNAGHARRAQDPDDVEEATGLRRKLFGYRFKATSDAAKAASLAGYATPYLEVATCSRIRRASPDAAIVAKGQRRRISGDGAGSV